MNRTVFAATLASCAALMGCGSDERAERILDPSETLRIHIALTSDACGVVTADGTVSAAGMETIGPAALEVLEQSIQGRIENVPAGSARTVAVKAYDAQRRVVYEGSTVVDVVAGQNVTANLLLARNHANCPDTPPPPRTGGIDVVGTIETGATPPDGAVLEGPAFAFGFSDAALTSDGVLHFFDPATDRVRRLSLPTRTLLPEVNGSADAVSFAVAPDGSVAYLGYSGGRIDVFDLAAGTSRFFGAAPATVSTMVVTGSYLFTIDDSGAWDTQSLYQRATGARTDAQEWRDTSRSIAYSPGRGRVYFLDSGVSPTDVNMVPIDLAAGKLGAETDSPYHGSYSLPNPIRLLPDESGVVVGSGLVFNAADLTYRTSIGLTFADVAFLGDRIYLIDTVGTTTQLRTLSSTFDILSAEYFPGQALRLFAYAGQLVLVTQAPTSLQVRFLSP
jgi:hypothetical protein